MRLSFVDAGCSQSEAIGPKETADVVADCLGAQVELVGDLFRRRSGVTAPDR
jgi:hypothetical protein